MAFLWRRSAVVGGYNAGMRTETVVLAEADQLEADGKHGGVAGDCEGLDGRLDLGICILGEGAGDERCDGPCGERVDGHCVLSSLISVLCLLSCDDR